MVTSERRTAQQQTQLRNYFRSAYDAAQTYRRLKASRDPEDEYARDVIIRKWAGDPTFAYFIGSLTFVEWLERVEDEMVRY